MTIHRTKPKFAFSRQLLEADIKGAQCMSVSHAEVAKRLGVSYNTYRKWARVYKLFDTFDDRRVKRIIQRSSNPKRGRFPLDDILSGKYPNYPAYRLKSKLFQSKYKERKCENCGWTEHRVIDGRGPFILDFIDDDPRNRNIDNLRILCLNCTHNIRGFIISGRGIRQHSLDLNLLQRPKANVKVEVVDDKDLVPMNEPSDAASGNLTEEEINQLMADLV